MENKNINRPSVSALERHSETDQSTATNPASINDSNTSECIRQQGYIEGVLQHGEENAISTRELTKLLEFKSARDLQIVIAQERESGALILSTCHNGGGYFLPDEGDKGRREIRGYITTLRNRALNTLKAVRAAKAALTDGG